MGDLDKDIRAKLTFDLTEDQDGCFVVKLQGELDMTTAPELDSAVSAVIARKPGRLVIDATGMEFADSSAIALLVRWANLVPRVEIRQPPELLRRVIARMGLSERLHVTP
jgi:anti-anti-sigma factor